MSAPALVDAAELVELEGVRLDPESALRNAVRIVKGNPSDEDIAVLVAIISAAHAAPQNVSQSPMSSLGDWGTPTDNLRYGLGAAPAHFVNAHYSR